MELDYVVSGHAFDWGKAAQDYSKYRDIYPPEFYEALHFFGVGGNGKRLLDIGTGSGVLVRNMCKYGGEFYGTDISPEQIDNARLLAKSENLDICFSVGGAEKLDFPDNYLDNVTAAQCWWYLDKSKAVPEIKRVLKPGGELVIAFMTWLSHEDEVVKKSFELVHKFNPGWKPYDFRTKNCVPPWVEGNFRMTTFHTFDVILPFTVDTWNGRMKASRGVGATLSPDEVESFSNEHIKMLTDGFGESFDVKHEIVIMKFKNI